MSDDYVRSDWEEMGRPTGADDDDHLTAWFKVYGENEAALREAFDQADFGAIDTIVDRLRNIVRKRYSTDVDRVFGPLSNVRPAIKDLEEIRLAMRGISEKNLSIVKEDLFIEAGHREWIDEVPDYVVTQEQWDTVSHILERADREGARGAKTFEDLAAFFTPEDLQAVQDIIDAVQTPRVFRMLARNVDLVNLRDNIAAVIVQKRQEVVQRSVDSALKMVRRVPDDLFMDLWEQLLEPVGRFEIYENVDKILTIWHKDFIHQNGKFAPGTPGFTAVWKSAVLSHARKVFLSGSYLGDAATRPLFSALHEDGSHPPLNIEKSLAITPDQTVLLATDPSGRKWVVKYSDTIKEEEAAWLRVGKVGGHIPDVVKGYHILGMRVLVVERLWQLDTTDDEYEVGAQIVRTQLPFVHMFALHADIKPDNIMKRMYGDGRTPDYFLIDMDLRTQKRVGDGFDRGLWTPLYNSKRPGVDFPMTWRNDILELLFSLHALALHRQYKNKVGPYGENKRSGFYPLDDILKKRDPEDPWTLFLESDKYADPITRMPQPNTPWWQAVEETLKSITGTLRPFGIRKAFGVLQVQPDAHPKHPETEEAYVLIADAFFGDESDAFFMREKDRKEYRPESRTAAAGPFAGAHVCWTCARTMDAMFREKTPQRRIFCDKRCQIIHHATPSGQHIL